MIALPSRPALDAACFGQSTEESLAFFHEEASMISLNDIV